MPVEFVVEVRQRARLERHGPGALFLRDGHRRAAQLVAGGVDALGRQQQKRAGPVDHLLGVPDALLEGGLLVDECGYQLGGIDLVAAHLRKMGPLAEGLPGQLVRVLDHPHRDDGVDAQVRADDQGLVLVITDDADAAGASHFGDVALELGAELGGFDVVDEPDEITPVVCYQPPSLRSQMGVIVGPVKQRLNTVVFRDDTKKSTHNRLSSRGGGRVSPRAVRSRRMRALSRRIRASG